MARIELKHDRPRATLRVLGFWPEEASLRREPDFAIALGRGLARLANFHRATTFKLAGLHSPLLQRRVAVAAKNAR